MLCANAQVNFQNGSEGVEMFSAGIKKVRFDIVIVRIFEQKISDHFLRKTSYDV